ncbi:hypothetical protein WG66_012728 [Moniliophthora roreri]|nr:hypothetical protein WG66_012728 [Moniliophthora roreri]
MNVAASCHVYHGERLRLKSLAKASELSEYAARLVASLPAFRRSDNSLPPVPLTGPLPDALLSSNLLSIWLAGHPERASGTEWDMVTTYRHAMRM